MYEEDSLAATAITKSYVQKIQRYANSTVHMLAAFGCSVKDGSESDSWLGKICPNIFKKLKVNIQRTQFLDVLWNGTDGFEVKHMHGRGKKYTVNLDKKHAHVGTFSLQAFLAAMLSLPYTSVVKLLMISLTSVTPLRNSRKSMNIAYNQLREKRSALSLQIQDLELLDM